MSLPSRERGLKFLTASQMSFASPVAPLAGAWIEIMDAIDQIHQLGKSLPSRERGLKYCDDITNGEQTVSLPSRERGLKLMENVEEIQQWGRSPRGSVD